MLGYSCAKFGAFLTKCTIVMLYLAKLPHYIEIRHSLAAPGKNGIEENVNVKAGSTGRKKRGTNEWR